MVVSIDLLDLEANKEVWELHTNDVARKEGFGARLILKNPGGDEIMYALRFDLYVSNNEAEYEALLAGLHLSLEVRAKHLLGFSDSLLNSSEVNETYKSKDQRMQRYLDAAR